jgi:phospholipid/cholesterol/gamma-HCH transport system substrate-binding protein
MKAFTERDPVRLGLLGTVVLALIVAVVFYAKDLPYFNGTTYRAEFTEAAGLRPSDEVRIAGIKVGEVRDVSLAEDRVLVRFKVTDAWIGNHTTASIKIKTLLGRKFLALNPSGDRAQDPEAAITRDRTLTPYDVTKAFEGLADTAGEIDAGQLAQSFRTISDTFRDQPAEVRAALDGLTALSKTISSRNQELAKLLGGARQLTTTLSDSDDAFDAIINDGNQLLAELNDRRNAIDRLITGARQLGTQLSGLVADNQARLGPALRQLDTVTGILQRHSADLDHSLKLAGPYFRIANNTAGSGRWLDTYLCGLIPENRNPCKVPEPREGVR